MAFNINGNTPPNYAAPLYPFSKGVIHPRGDAYDGNGNVVGAVGPIEAEVGRRWMSAAGHTWWMNFFASATDQSVAVTNVVIYDELEEQERTFSTGIMLRPEWGEHNPGVVYRDYRVKFTKLVA